MMSSVLVRHAKSGFRLCPLILPIFLLSCGGSGEGLDANGRPLYENASVSVNTAESGTTLSGSDFNRIQSDMLDVACATSGCHSGTSAPLGLNLDAGKAYAKLVNQLSIQVSGLLLVEPNNPDASYLMHKLDGSQNGGMQMPLGKPAIKADQLAQVRQWILDGALAPVAMPEQDKEPDKDNVPEQDNSDVGPRKLQPTLEDIQAKVFDESCTGCHGGSAPSAELSLASGQSYTQLVERASGIDPLAKPLVSIGDPENSFLIDKLRGRSLGTAGSADDRGRRMPVVGQFLSEDDVQAIELWISNGATEVSN